MPEQFDQMMEQLYQSLLEYGPRLAITLLLAVLGLRGAGMVLSRLEARMGEDLAAKRDLPTESAKRIRTLFRIFRKTANVAIILVAGLLVLNTFQVEIGPILAAAGVVGLAVSFGAQSLVKDLIAGIFILFENQIRVGDVAIINGTTGLVEEINLRTVVLRDLSGTVHIWPNGSITGLSNKTKDWSAVVMDIGVDYKEDLDKVYDVIRATGKAMREEPAWGTKIIEDVEVLGLDGFGNSSLDIKVRIKTKPIEQWEVGREFRKRLKASFDEAGISIPFPHRTLYFGEVSKPIELLLAKRRVEANEDNGARTDEAEPRAKERVSAGFAADRRKSGFGEQ